MRTRSGHLQAVRLRREGIRVSAGPWSICAKPSGAGPGRLIVALGRAAGPAVTRSRVRRIARSLVSGQERAHGDTDLLILARADVSGQSRRTMRAALGTLLKRLPEATARRRTG